MQAPRAAATMLEGDAGPDAEARITAALPPDAPREARNFLLTLAKEGTPRSPAGDYPGIRALWPDRRRAR